MARTRTHGATAPTISLHPEVFDRHREVIDELTDAAHRLMRRLDIEIRYANKSAKVELQRWRDQIADMGSRLDDSDPEADGGCTAWLPPLPVKRRACGPRAH